MDGWEIEWMGRKEKDRECVREISHWDLLSSYSSEAGSWNGWSKSGMKLKLEPQEDELKWLGERGMERGPQGIEEQPAAYQGQRHGLLQIFTFCYKKVELKLTIKNQHNSKILNDP